VHALQHIPHAVSVYIGSKTIAIHAILSNSITLLGRGMSMETRLWYSCRTVKLEGELWRRIIVRETVLCILLWGGVEASRIEQLRGIPRLLLGRKC
jgi:hypothetical protein